MNEAPTYTRTILLWSCLRFYPVLVAARGTPISTYEILVPRRSECTYAVLYERDWADSKSGWGGLLEMDSLVATRRVAYAGSTVGFFFRGNVWRTHLSRKFITIYPKGLGETYSTKLYLEWTWLNWAPDYKWAPESRATTREPLTNLKCFFSQSNLRDFRRFTYQNDHNSLDLFKNAIKSGKNLHRCARQCIPSTPAAHVRNCKQDDMMQCWIFA